MMDSASNKNRIWWKAVLFFVVVAAGHSALAQPSSPSWTEIIAEAGGAVVVIETEVGQGSGFIVQANGTLITNDHVVADARSIRVQLSNGETFDRVHVLTSSQSKDLAVLRVEGFDLPVLKLGNSNDVVVGEEVVAIGAPKGLDQTVTRGLVSATRVHEGTRLIQTDAAITYGSSGGPLLNKRGEVVGVVSRGMDGEDIKFAVAINHARGMLEALDLASAQTTERVLQGAPPRNKGGVLVAGYGEADVFQLVFVELLNFLAEKRVAIANDPGDFTSITGDHMALPHVLDRARDAGADSLLFLRTGEDGARFQCFNAREELLWDEKFTVKGMRDEVVAERIMSEVRTWIGPRIGKPGLALKKLPAGEETDAEGVSSE